MKDTIPDNKEIDQELTHLIKKIETSEGNVGNHYLDIAAIIQNANINTATVNGNSLNMCQLLYKSIQHNADYEEN